MTLPGYRIAELRREMGISQKDLTERLNLNPNQVSRYERGVMNPPYDTLVQIATLFNTTTDYLLGLSNKRNADAEPEPLLSPPEAEMLALMRQYDADFQAEIVTVFKSLDGTWAAHKRGDEDESS